MPQVPPRSSRGTWTGCRLCAERFQAARLVVDTCLNVAGWTRERAAKYLRTNGFLSETEISSELHIAE